MIFLCSTLLYSRRLSTMGENKFWKNIIILLLKNFSYIVFVSRISCRYCLTNVSVFVVFPETVNLLCELPCGGRFRDLVLDPFYRIIETGLIYLSSLNPIPSGTHSDHPKLERCSNSQTIMQNWLVKVLKGLILHQESRLLESYLKSQLYDAWISLLNLFDSIVI